MKEYTNQIPFSNPVPILQQTKSKMVHNSLIDQKIDQKIVTQIPIQQLTDDIQPHAFISESQKQQELNNLQKEANHIFDKSFVHESGIQNLSILEINNRISDSVVGILNDIYIKPSNEDWIPYFFKILKYKERYTYIGIILIFISLYIYIIHM